MCIGEPTRECALPVENGNTKMIWYNHHIPYIKNVKNVEVKNETHNVQNSKQG